jgi:nucleoid-associated protein YgaU
MSRSRLAVTSAVMAAVAAGLREVTPDLTALTDGGLDLQRLVDTAGPEDLLLTGVAAMAWLAWTWGALGLVLTALSALPGLAGAAARVLLRRVLPASARRAAALALGVGLVTAPALTACTTPPPGPGVVLAADVRTTSVPDWPAPPDRSAPPVSGSPAPGAAVPDWPAPAPGDHVVLRGECLWSIAEEDLRARTGLDPGPADVAAAVQRWWTTNADVIGDDPDLLLPGQVLRPPA